MNKRHDSGVRAVAAHVTDAAGADTAPWTPGSWQRRPALQQPIYDDPIELARAGAHLAELPPLVTSWEVLALKDAVAEAQEGKRFLLQGGDCAESFADCTSPVISNRLKVLLQMSLVLVHGLKKPVLRVGRFAGQYAKPRSADNEVRDGVSLPSFRGDVVNSQEFTATARRPDPQRLIQAHAHSALTMNFVRALIDGGFADLRHPEYWDLAWVEHSPLAAEYRKMVAGISDSLHFMETLAGPIASFSKVDFFTSHEALLLHYEQALTRQVPRNPGWFNLSTHFPWIGMRTAALDGAHVEYFRGIRNPVAVKIGPSVTADQLLPLIDVLDPHAEPGRLTLIHRMGQAKIADALPPLLEAVKREGRRVLWVADPMHGNTEGTSNGHKTRRFDNIRGELDQAFDIHAAAGTRLGGVHLELTGEDVTECIGGARDLKEGDLDRAYKSMVDPRLNYEQSLELAMLIVRKSTGGAG
ncbi:class II 3-deoxy-7-phosphoheptulonate synthase [Rhodanobacter lindaniclasticus]|uniref:Phospho-2-dehydro-3-deoxyheptonate aldolase n=1 Tax=Rhodanobacter lindaniclasticus TaxID=75310 RepID=A0A4S3KE16_9GAMM|nr:3-deoxy-7-phosphoheptulonate synthase class II [Rhodanobacter lindaniclasticus]THD06498.1 3-deoxy-7-phosphoheptulonate synthase [Rhodanobacter lindaniclasticus]